MELVKEILKNDNLSEEYCFLVEDDVKAVLDILKNLGYVIVKKRSLEG